MQIMDRLSVQILDELCKNILFESQANWWIHSPALNALASDALYRYRNVV